MRVVAGSLAALSAAVLVPFAAGALIVRPRWRRGLRERIGRWPRQLGAPVWVHAASLGEIGAAMRLIDRLESGGSRVLASTSTLVGRDAMRRNRPDVPCHLAPLDHPWCVASALERVRPSALVLVEGEIWPFWIGAAVRRGIPVVLVSGRVSDSSLQKYRWLWPGIRRTLRRLSAIGARTQEDARRWIELGAPTQRVSVTGDLKLDPTSVAPSLSADLDRFLGAVPLVVGASTHPGEESALLEAIDLASTGGGEVAALILAPRRIERAGEIEALVRRSGREAHLRSRLSRGPLAPGEVLILDSLGELAAIHARARAVFVGGTLVPVGGHNLVEPALAGRPVLFGPHTDRVRHAERLLTHCGAGHRVDGAGSLAAALADILSRPGAAEQRGERGRAALERERGATERSLALVEAALAAPHVVAAASEPNR